MATIGRHVVGMKHAGTVILRSKMFSPHPWRAFSASMSRQAVPVGFVGLGNMGAHMARNLLKNGYPVVVYDVVEESVQSLRESGADTGSSPADVATKVKHIVTMLPSSPHVKDVYLGPKGILSAVQKGTLLLDSSTIDPSVSTDMAKEAQAHGATYCDAPVSGGVMAARDANLTFMVGASAADYEAGKEFLSKMGKNVIHCGDVGTGQAAKICNNMLLGITMIGVSETMNLGTRLGLDPKLLAKVLNTSSGRCWSSEIYNPFPGVVPGTPSCNNYQGGFGTALMTKDLGLAQNAATATTSPTPMGSLAHQMYRIMINSGYGPKDFSSVFQFLQEQESK